jgi:hypothetical protein
MKRKTNDLQNLVLSLSGGEKRYFSLFSKAFSKNEGTLYLDMYQRLAKGESKLLDEEKGYTPTVITMTKQRLFNNILKSLRLYYQDKSVDMVIQNQLSEVEILYKLGLPEQGLLLIHKAYQLAESNEKFGLLLQVLEWEKRMNIVLDIPSRAPESIAEDERATLDKLRQIMSLEHIYSKALKLKKQYGYAKGDARQELENETILSTDMPPLKDCLSNKAVFYHNFIYAIYYWMIFDHHQSFSYSKRLMEPGKNAILPSDFINALLQHITSSVCLGYFEDTLNGIQVGEVYVKEYHLDQSRTFNSLMYVYQATYEMIVYNYMGMHQQLIESIKRTEERMLHLGQAIPFELRLVLSGNLMNAYMGIGEVNKSDELWDSLFNKQSSAIRRDVYADLYLFRLFRLLQDKNYALVAPAALSAYRYYRKFEDAKAVFEVELPISLLLQKEHRWEQSSVRGKMLKQLQSIVQDYIDQLEGARRFQEHYSRYVIWCEAILKDEPYHQAAARWYKKYRTIPRK